MSDLESNSQSIADTSIIAEQAPLGDKNNLLIVPAFITTPDKSYYERGRGLYQHHYDECLERGLTPEAVAELVANNTLRSFTIKKGSGLRSLDNFPDQINNESIEDVLQIIFHKDFAQIKLDGEFYRDGKRLKYLSSSGIKSAAWYPQGFGSAGQRVITEGWFDAALGTYIGGIPTAAVAGVSHYKQAIDSDLKAVILFDSDGRTNHGVIASLYIAGKYSNNKIQLIPPIEGEPKAGLEEYFKAGNTAEDYRKLIEAAITPLRFLYSIINGDLPQDERKLRLVKQICLLAAKYEKRDEAFALLDEACKKAKLSAATKQSIKDRMLQVIKSAEDNKAKEKKARDLAAPVLKKDSALYQEAKVLLDSGKLFDEVERLIKLQKVIGLQSHVIFDLIASVGILWENLSRTVSVLYSSSSRGGGKSAAQNLKAELMPPENVHVVDVITPSWLKRAGSTLKNKQVISDELVNLFGDTAIFGLVKTLQSKGSLRTQMTESVNGKFVAIDLEILGPVSFSTCCVASTRADILGNQEDEIVDRFLVITPPDTGDYFSAVNERIIVEDSMQSISEIDSHAVEVVREAIRIAMSRPAPKTPRDFMQCLSDNCIRDMSIARFFKDFRILLINCTSLLGQDAVGMDAYKVVYPLLSIMAQNKVSNCNPESLEMLRKLYKYEAENRKTAYGDFLFNANLLTEVFSPCSLSTAYEKLKTLKKTDWLDVGETKGNYRINQKGKDTLTKDVVFTEVIPNPDALAEAFRRFSAVIPTHSDGFPIGLNPVTVSDTADILPKIASFSDDSVERRGNKLKLISEVEQVTENKVHKKEPAIPKKGQRVVVTDTKLAKYQEEGEVKDIYNSDTGVEVSVCMDKEFEVYSFPLLSLTIIDNKDTIIQSESEPQPTLTRTRKRFT